MFLVFLKCHFAVNSLDAHNGANVWACLTKDYTPICGFGPYSCVSVGTLGVSDHAAVWTMLLEMLP